MVNGQQTTVGRSRLFFRLQVHETTRLRVGETGCLLSLISQGCAVGLYMADPFKLMDYCSLLKANRPLSVVRCLKKTSCLVVWRSQGLVDMLSRCLSSIFIIYSHQSTAEGEHLAGGYQHTAVYHTPWRYKETHYHQCKSKKAKADGCY